MEYFWTYARFICGALFAVDGRDAFETLPDLLFVNRLVLGDCVLEDVLERGAWSDSRAGRLS